MFIEKLIVKNFKKFDSKEFQFNNDVNIIVGDNEAGKSTLLDAIELVLNATYKGKPISGELSTNLFNRDSIAAYLAGNLSVETLPEILIEAYISGEPELKGNNNSLSQDTEGLFIKILFDEDLAKAYKTFLENYNSGEKPTTLPIEFYKYEWYGFQWNGINRHSKKPVCLPVDAARLHPTYGKTKYISTILESELDREARTSLNLKFRQLKSKFDSEPDVIAINNTIDADNAITDKSLKVTADIGSTNSWESALQLAVNDITFDQIGKGEQSQIQIKLALSNKSGDVNIVLVEEPENHLSHINLITLLKSVEERNKGKQLFITTHSSYVLNKLSADKIGLLSNNEFKRFTSINPKTVKTLKRLPGYDTLRVILAQKIILVEGPSDELLLKKLYLDQHGELPEEAGIDIIVVRGIGFKNYLNIAKELEHPVRVVKDNDGKYQINIENWFTEYKEFASIYSPKSDELYSLEPALIVENDESIKQLDILAKEFLSTKTFNLYNKNTSLKEKKEFLIAWFKGTDTGTRKVDSAIRIFEGSAPIKFPDYLIKAIEFDA